MLGYVGLALRCFIAGSFAVAFLSKSLSSASASEFTLAVRTFGGFKRPAISRAVAIAVIVLEAGTVAMLVPAGTVVSGFALACVLLVTFTIVVIVAIRRGVRQPCRCFGHTASETGPANVVRNLALLSGSLAGLVITAVHGAGTAHLDPLGAVLAVVTGLIAAGLVITSEDLVAVFRRPSWLRTQQEEGVR